MRCQGSFGITSKFKGLLSILERKLIYTAPKGLSDGVEHVAMRAFSISFLVFQLHESQCMGAAKRRRALTGLKWRAAGSATSREWKPAPAYRPARAMRLPAGPGKAGGRRAGLARGRGAPLARGGARRETPLLASRRPPRAPGRLALITWEIFFNSLLLGRRAPPRKSPS